MKNYKKITKIILIIFAACFVWLLGGYFLNKTFHNNVRNKPKRYAYQTYWGVINPVLYVKSKNDIDSLISYYQKVENGNSNPEFNFPPHTMPYDTCVYIIGYERDSLIAKVISYYEWGRQGSYVKGYVYRKTLHNNPPPDSLIKRY